MTAGRPLTELLAEGPMGAAAIDLLDPLAVLVDDLHCRGSVHGRLAPDHVVVGPDGRPSIVPAGRPPGPDTTAGWSDEPVYTAPEGALGHRADLFSFAGIAFHAITGSPPHTVASVRRGGWDRVPRASDRQQGLPTALDAVFRSALHPQPTERPPSAGDLVTALRDAFGARYRPPAATARRRVVAISAAAVTVALVVAAALTLRPPSGDGAPPAIDPAAPFVLVGGPTPVGADPADVEAGEGYVWVSGAADGSLTRIDPADGSTVRYDIGGEPGQIVVGDGAVWVRNLGDRITRVDVATGTVSPPVSGGGVPISGMAVGAGHVWLSHIGDGTVTRVDLRTLAVVGNPIAVGPEPRALELGPDALYVANTGDGSISRVDTATAQVTGTAAAGSALGGMEIDDGVLYVAADGGIVPIPEATFRPGERYEYDGWSYFEVAAGAMWVVDEDSPAVRRFDVTGRRAIGESVLLPGTQIGRARFAFGRLWMTVPGDGTVVVLGPGDG